ncbi:MAG: DUF2235 domain-containing protein [Leptospirales bacterium]
MATQTKKKKVIGKNIIICSDGTGNSAAKSNKTNVFKIFESVNVGGFYDKEAKGLRKQVAFYDDGVGNDDWKPLKILGGMFGYGVSKNICQLYEAIARVYKPGDKLFFFGFSRGAYTVRALAGLIATCGIVDIRKSNLNLGEATKDAYKVYRRKYHTLIGSLGHMIMRTPKLENFREKFAVHRTKDDDGIPAIEFIGVWDSTSAVGIPVEIIKHAINKYVYKFEFTNNILGQNVKKAYHAISIDDERKTLRPNIWKEQNNRNKDQVIEQVWFSGVHSNVGGGYPKSGMSHVSLDWMMNRAEAAGVQFSKSAREDIKALRNINDKCYNPRSGLNVYYRYLPRDIARLSEKAGTDTPKVHYTTFEKIVQCPEGYGPTNLPTKLEVVKDKETINVGNIQNQWIAISSPLGGVTSLLDKVKTWITFRRIAHFLLMTVTFSLGFFYVVTEGVVSLFSMDISIELVTNLWKALIDIPWLIGYLVIIIALVLGFGLFGRAKMGKIINRFWKKNRDSLQEGFDL